MDTDTSSQTEIITDIQKEASMGWQSLDRG